MIALLLWSGCRDGLRPARGAHKRAAAPPALDRRIGRDLAGEGEAQGEAQGAAVQVRSDGDRDGQHGARRSARRTQRPAVSLAPSSLPHLGPRRDSFCCTFVSSMMLLGQWTFAEEASGADESERRCDAHDLYARAGQREDDEAARQADSRGDGAPAHRHATSQHRAAVRTAGDDTRGGVGREQVDGSALGLPALARGEDEGACQGPGRDGPQR